MKLVGDTLENILVQLPSDLKLLNTAFEDSDMKLVSIYAHKMGPNMMLIGRDDIKDLLRKIEVSIDSKKDLESVPMLIQEVTNECPGIIKELSLEVVRIKETLNLSN